jgi:hypothetical protein
MVKCMAYPCVYKVFDLHESTDVYIKCEGPQLLSYTAVRGNTNSQGRVTI